MLNILAHAYCAFLYFFPFFFSTVAAKVKASLAAVKKKTQHIEHLFKPVRCVCVNMLNISLVIKCRNKIRNI